MHIKKELLNLKRKDSENNTYSGIITKKTTAASEPAITTKIDNDTHPKKFTSILHAHFTNVESPGSYEVGLNKTLIANELPPIKIPTVPKSEKILPKFFNSNQTNERKEPEEQQTTKKRRNVGDTTKRNTSTDKEH